MSEISENLGTRPIRPLPSAVFPDVGKVLSTLPTSARPEGAVDVLLVNPPAPDGAIWIRSQHRVGRRSRENMVWPQVSLAQLAALLHPDYSVDIIDAIPHRMSWEAFEELVRQKSPRYYVTQVTAPTLTNDMRGTFLARSLGAQTIAFGTHVTPMPVQTMEAFPTLDYVLRGEPELTLRELIDTLEWAAGRRLGAEQKEPDPKLWARLEKMSRESDPDWEPPWDRYGSDEGHLILNRGLPAIKGLVWRRHGGIEVNTDRPFIRDLDDLPLPMHHLLPWPKYRVPNIRGPYTFVVPSRGCPAGCTFCIKHVSYQYSVRVRSAENVLEELKLLWDLGLRNVHMYADLFTVNREQVMGICEGMIREGLDFKWMCNSRVDYVDPEMLQMMSRAGCWLISWGIESANDQIRRNVHKGTTHEKIVRALGWSKEAGIMNWGYFIIGLPGETEDTIQETIRFSKRLPLDLALFHIAAPYPGTPFFFEVVENGWFRPGTTWEEVDMDESTVLDYPGLPAERIEYWARRAFREWALRPGPMWTFLKSMNNWQAAKSAINAGWQALGWMR
ncbi:MAG: B12-binding domain-containing radical SAM protein [Anaerolineae bacterium]